MLASNWVVFRCYSCRQQAGGLPGTNLTCGYCRAWLQVPPPLPLPVFYPSPNVLPPLPVHPPPLHARVEGALKRARPVLSGGVSAAAKRGRGNGPSEPGRDDTHKGVKEIGHAVEWTAEDERSLGDWVCKVKQNAAKKAVEWYLKTADDAVALQLQITAADSEYQAALHRNPTWKAARLRGWVTKSKLREIVEEDGALEKLKGERDSLRGAYERMKVELLPTRWRRLQREKEGMECRSDSSVSSSSPPPHPARPADTGRRSGGYPLVSPSPERSGSCDAQPDRMRTSRPNQIRAPKCRGHRFCKGRECTFRH
eukprot:Hpha_TRINITY_DN14478_c0_g1::TRINITY_DN14478_c0_g1_i1::g.157438::m.157438